MQIDLIPVLPINGGYQTVMTAMDVFSRYLFAYPLVEATASKTAKILIDIMTNRHICRLHSSLTKELPSPQKSLQK